MIRALDIWRGGRHDATLSIAASGEVAMKYTSPDAPRISASLPNDGMRPSPETVRHFFEGLLPDRAEVRSGWADVLSEGLGAPVDPADPFALLRYLGSDVAGALQILPSGETPGRVDPLVRVDDREIASRLRSRSVSSASTAGARASDRSNVGWFALAGGQSKLALTSFDGGSSWYESTDCAPSTHILKPSAAGHPGQALIEHLSLEGAARLGLDVARSEYRIFYGTPALISERHDRAVADDEIMRLHQEDLCQALGAAPARKYESDGGPRAHEFARLILDDAGHHDAMQFVRSLAYSAVIGSADGHAKNYALRHGEDGSVTLAPLYDVCSFHPWASSRRPTGTELPGLHLAFAVGSTSRIESITAGDWELLARRSGLEEGEVVAAAAEVIAAAPDAIADAVRSARGSLPVTVEDERRMARLVGGTAHHARMMRAGIRGGAQ
ncbi:HipA domain-containing protein [Brachybacterium sp. JHP9]|uniref:HipA domain-containing protein n=1 Tax=Brachybacterium equifaecis TaxID=2910770 RepID=A0ABT0R367_9MICO|nr:HipA domain-containing protein [Brachybacterium equifaecis]MCL6424362.1 HipA domain-containing protein [Brachybacterium equifaecis]